MELTTLENTKIELQEKRKQVIQIIKYLGLKYNEVIDSLDKENNDDLETTLFMKKAEYLASLYENSQKGKQLRESLIKLQRLKAKIKQSKLFQREDICNIICYLISVMENQMCDILHDEVGDFNYTSFEKYFPCLVVNINEKSVLVNEKHFPYVVTFLDKVINYLVSKIFYQNLEYSNDAIEVLTYEELYNLVNIFINEYQTKTKK